MFSHITVGTNDLPNARVFYDSVLGALGYENLGNKETASLWGGGRLCSSEPSRSR